MTSGPNLVPLFDALALTWCVLHGDRDGQAVILEHADLGQVARGLAVSLAAELAAHHGHERADEIVSRTRAVLLEMEQGGPSDGRDPIWPD